MKKVLWVSDGVTPTGFSRVAHNLISRAPSDFEIHHLAINYFGDPHNYKHKIYPAYPGGDVYGFGRIVNLIEVLKPDIVFLFNDINVIARYLIEINNHNIKDVPISVYYPVDSKYIAEEYFSFFDVYVNKIFVYTKFGEEETRKVYKGSQEIIRLPHGVDKHFHKLDEEFVLKFKKQLTGDENSFIFLNANRNQPRKRIDITMKAFSLFSKDKDDVKLYLHMGLKDAGWDIVRLARRYGISDKLILTNNEVGVQKVPDSTLNAIYNMATVGVQTSIGEGFGLTAVEMGSLGKPQIVPNNSASGELFGDIGITVEPIMTDVAVGTNSEFSVVRPEDVADAMERIYTDKEYYKEVAEKTEKKFTSPEYDWDNIAKILWDNL